MGYSEKQDPKEGEQAATVEAWERFGDRITGLFNEHPDIDWLVIGDTSGTIISTGTDDELPSEKTFQHWQAVQGERLHLFGPPVEISG